MIAVYRSSDYLQTQLLKGLLEHHCVQVFLHGGDLQGGLGEAAVLGHLSLMVNEMDCAAAQDIVDAYERGDFALSDEDL